MVLEKGYQMGEGVGREGREGHGDGKVGRDSGCPLCDNV